MKQSRIPRVVLLANGDLYDPDYVRTLLRSDDVILAANGGTRLAQLLQVYPDYVIGDSDSLSEPLQQWIKQNNVPQRNYSRDKDETDLELAFRYAIQMGTQEILLLGATGSRLDHTLANISLLALAKKAGIMAELVVGRQHLFLVYDRIELEGAPGQIVSLLPWGGDGVGVRTKGLRWELRDETLPFGPARGISNVMTGNRVTISLRGGMLLVCQHRGEEN